MNRYFLNIILFTIKDLDTFSNVNERRLSANMFLNTENLHAMSTDESRGLL